MMSGFLQRLLITLVTIFPIASWAQGEWVPGILYLKLHADFPHSLPEGKWDPERMVLPDANLDQLAKVYQWREIRQAFPRELASLRSVYEIRFYSQHNVVAVCGALNGLALVDYAEPVPWVRSQYLPNDFDSLDLPYLSLVRAPEAWDYHKGDSAVVIGIVDNAVLTTHSDLAANLWVNPGEIPGDGLDNDNNGYVDDLYGWDIADGDADPNPPNRNFRHGTHVAGCASAVTDNGNGVASLGFSCSLMPVKVASDTGFSDAYPFSTALRGVAYAITSGAHIVNMSFGGREAPLTGQALIDAGHAKGVIFVAAAGNANDTLYEYPASYRHVISVAATNLSSRKAPFSNYNRHVDVAAPGVSIRNTVPSASLGASYTLMSGTSQATAMVSGLLGLMRSMNPCLDPDEAEALLKAGCKNLDTLNPAYAGLLGAGLIDAAASLALLQRNAAPLAQMEIRDSLACDSLLQVFYLSPGLAACPESWEWHCSNGQVSAEVAPVFSFDSSGTYEIRLIVRNAFGEDSAVQSFSVRLGLRPLVVGEPDTVVQAGDTVFLKATGNSVSYQWTPAAGLFPNAQVAAPYFIADSSRYYVVTGLSAEGCAGSDTVFVEVEQTTRGYTEPTDQDSPVFSVYPNPVTQTFWLESDYIQGGNLQVNLVSMDGKIQQTLFERTLPGGSFREKLFLPAVPQGLYLLRITVDRKCVTQLIRVF